MESKEHLKLPIYKENIERFKRGGGGKSSIPVGRDKGDFSQNSIRKSQELINQHSQLKDKFSGKVNPSLIYEIEITQKMHIDTLVKNLKDMGIQVLSIAENKQGFWIVFNERENLTEFQRKLREYGSEDGHNYDFFNVIENFQTIPIEKKIGQKLKENPIEDEAEFVDIELWKMNNQQLNEKFIQELEEAYEPTQLRVTDRLVTNSFVLIRAKLTKEVFDEIIELNEIARIDSPSIPQFNPVEFIRPDVSDVVLNSPPDDAMGILVIDSGVISNHPMLEKCIGAEENFQSGEREIQDTVGHGTSVAGCVAYGDIESSLVDKEFTPSNWIFSAKIMYAEKDWNGDAINPIYDPEKLVEHQFKDAVISFLSNATYRIKVINISLGNVKEVWQKHYTRQLPFATLIDELALQFPHVTFIISTGNQSPLDYFDSIAEIKDNYPKYLTEQEDFKIINPATSALALTVGSIAQEIQIETERYGAESIKLPIAKQHQPSPFTRVGKGINGMVKPELVEYGGNLILSEEHGRTIEDRGGKVPLLNNKIDNIIKFDYGTSFSAPKVAHLAGKIANQFPQKSSNFIKNMLLVGADYPFVPNKIFYNVNTKEKAIKKHLSTSGYGLSSFDKAIHSFDNRTVLWDEGEIGLNQIKVYSLQLPDIFFQEEGKKKITVVLTFNPETRSTRGDSYLGNHLEFHLFHSINPNVLIEKYGVISSNEVIDTPDDMKKFEIKFFPGSNTLKSGCHQKAWKEFHRNPQTLPQTPVSLVLLNVDKWIQDENRMQDYCISVTFEHEKEIELYSVLRANIQPRVRIR